VGRFILQDLKSASARIDAEIQASNRNTFTVVIDEFADIAQEDFISFLDRARSSKFSIVVAHQEICDLLRISPEFAGRLMGNTSTLYAFLQKRPESAETISKMAGTRTVWKTTFQTDRSLFFDFNSGKGSKREVEEFLIHPNDIKSQRVGECVVIKKYPNSSSHRLKVKKGLT
jgi:type IV secretory pathway TraG/TraD family ATPase VirD4